MGKNETFFSTHPWQAGKRFSILKSLKDGLDVLLIVYHKKTGFEKKSLVRTRPLV
jgi:hypothetical protein